MSITKRRIDFLKTLAKLCKEQECPVHYSLVAEKLGVSKWTAYDLLTALKEEGYVEVLYILNEKSGGRSSIAFKLTPKGEDVISEGHREDIERTRREIREKIESSKKLSINEVLQAGLKEISEAKSPILKALDISIVLYILSQKIAINWDSISSVYNTLSKNIDPQSGLLGLTALLTGLILAKAGLTRYGGTLSIKLEPLLSRYKEILQGLSFKEKETLLSITREIYREKLIIGKEE
ncbi:MAG: hypothetical protein ACP5RW_00555 [bacterium]